MRILVCKVEHWLTIRVEGDADVVEELRAHRFQRVPQLHLVPVGQVGFTLQFYPGHSFFQIGEPGSTGVTDTGQALCLSVHGSSPSPRRALFDWSRTDSRSL